MAFKIVQTIEQGVPKLTVVPTLWESKGIVRWPPKTSKLAYKLIKNGNSNPGPEWKSYKCVLKRDFIRTYEEADKELRRMEQSTDTDDNAHCNVPGTSNSNPYADDGEINFDAFAQDLTTLDNPQPSASDSRALATNVFCQQQDTIQVFNSEDIQSVIANQAAMLEKLNVIMENQKRIAFKLATLTIQLDETKASISQEKERPVNVTLLQDQLRLEEENESFSIKPIENLQQFEMLEMDLVDKAKKKKLSKTLSLLCSSKVGRGRTCAYKLLDILFTKNFLCQCSWSGGSRGEISKIPFKNYKNFRKFFFEIVNSWDSNFTDDDAENFLKLAIRNASKRNSMKGVRQSSQRTRNNRNREQGLNYKASNISEELQVGDEDNGNNGEEPQAGKKREQFETALNGDNNEETRSDESMDLC